jgi:hypothetical protein
LTLIPIFYYTLHQGFYYFHFLNFSSQKPTGGYSVKGKRIYQKKKGTLDIYCVDKEPEGEFGTMAFTQPCKKENFSKKQGFY